MPTPSNLAGRLTRFCYAALENGSALAANNHVSRDLGGGMHLVTWLSPDENPDLSNLSIEDLNSYLFFLRNSHYSIVCQDGSIIQMSFKIRRGEIVNHRLCYIPCPVAFDPVELEGAGLDEIVERNLHSANLDLLRQRGVFRFDFDPSAVAAEHPASHLTANYDEVRIPVSRNLDARTFLDFIDRHFVATREGLTRFLVGQGGDPCNDVLAADHRGRPHLSWAVD